MRRRGGSVAHWQEISHGTETDRGKKEARGGSLQPCEAPGTSGRRRRAAPRLLRVGSELSRHSNGGRVARIGFGDTVVGMGFRRGADCAQIGPGAILGMRASGNCGTGVVHADCSCPRSEISTGRSESGVRTQGAGGRAAGGSRGGRARAGWSTGRRASAAEVKQRARAEIAGGGGGKN